MRKQSTRQGFGDGLMELVRDRGDLIMVAADTYRSFALGEFVRAFPQHYLEFGIAEQNMLDAAAGLAADGEDTVFAVGYSTFLSLRAAEQLRTFIAYPNLNVKVVAGLAGLSGDTDSVTHQGTEDLAIVRAIPNISLVCPADYVAAKRYVKILADTPGPFYLRIGRGATPVVYPDDQPFELGKATVTRDYGGDFTVIATGPCVAQAVEAADLLREKGIGVRVLDVHSIRPLDGESVIKAAEETGGIVTVEDGTVCGLGGAVAELLAESGKAPARFRRLGLRSFGTCGELEDLMKHFGIDAGAIASAVEDLCK